MKRWLVAAFTLSACVSFAAQDVVSAVEGTVKKIDAGTKVVVVKTEDGGERTFHYTDSLAVHMGKGAAAASKDSLHGLKEGSAVAVHYSTMGGKDVAHEIDSVGDDGLKVAKGTISQIDRKTRTVSIKTADGADESYRLTGRAAADTGKDIAEGAHATFYYTEDATGKTVHFIKKIV